MKIGKSRGSDNVNNELLKLLDDEDVKWLSCFFNRVYLSGKISHESLRSEFITLLKKPRIKNVKIIEL